MKLNHPKKNVNTEKKEINNQLLIETRIKNYREKLLKKLIDVDVF